MGNCVLVFKDYRELIIVFLFKVLVRIRYIVVFKGCWEIVFCGLGRRVELEILLRISVLIRFSFWNKIL